MTLSLSLSTFFVLTVLATCFKKILKLIVFRGVNDDDEVSGPSPVGGRQSGPRDKSELYRDHGEGVDRHAKYYNDPREPKSCNQRRNAR